MRKSRIGGLLAMLLAGTVILSLVAGCASAASTSRPVRFGAQLAELKASDISTGTYFGSSVALSGTSTAVVGALNPRNSIGQAYIFTKTESGWIQVARLRDPDRGASDGFGCAVGISGNTAVVGAESSASGAGRAYVFTRTRLGWHQTAELRGSDTLGHDRFGISVAISGRSAIVGALGHAQNAGRAYIFTDSRSGWRQVAELKGSNVAESAFGESVAISEQSAVVGSFGYLNKEGTAYVYSMSDGSWRQAAQLEASSAGANDEFGISVAVSGRTVVVGALNPNALGGGSYVFTKTAAGWTETADLNGTIGKEGEFEQFGTSVAISGDTIVLGGFNHRANVGVAEMIVKTDAGWSRTIILRGSNTGKNDYFGTFGVAVSGAIAIIGAPNRVTGRGVGRVFVFAT